MQSSAHYDYSQASEFPKKNMGRDLRVWSPNLLSHRLPSHTLNNNTHYTNNIPSPNEYDYPTTALYPKKDMGRDPRVWSPNLLSHQLPNNNTHVDTPSSSQQPEMIHSQNYSPNEYDYPTTALYPKKDMGRDPRVWSPNLLSHRLPNANDTHTESQSSNHLSIPNEYLIHYDYPQGVEYPKKDMGRDPRVWSPNLLSHRLPNNNNNNDNALHAESQSSNQPSIPNEYLTHYDYPTTAHYPKKDMGRDPRVWSPNLLSHRLPENSSSSIKSGEVVYPVKRYSRAKL
eukprot:TRINITY_DN211_c0_g1_i2.p1 TRINITY_DN211_c0_g1~~TRINITY_DN211_c0_g1_i2.p1  ORF type:complete len:285 (-),score=72.69 TRINITY_DN211_c0_g1_i2:97-951(-)